MSRRTELLMGGHPFTVATDRIADDALLDAAFAELRAAEALFSPFRADSAVSRINAGTLRERDADRLVREVLDLCRAYAARTGGYFSAWRGGRLDPSGLVKGWAIARAAAVLERAGCRRFFVDGAGDVTVRGAWRVGVRHPRERDRVAGVVELRDLAIATSGTYEKGPHIVDPHDGAPATELVSLTVIGRDITAADAYATAAFAMGRAGVAFVEGLRGYEAMAIDGELFSAETSGWSRLLARDYSIAAGTSVSPSTP